MSKTLVALSKIPHDLTYDPREHWVVGQHTESGTACSPADDRNREIGAGGGGNCVHSRLTSTRTSRSDVNIGVEQAVYEGKYLFGA